MSSLKFLVRLGIGAALVAYLVHEHEVRGSEIAGKLVELPTWVLLLALALDLAGQSLSAYRWSRIAALGGYPTPYRTAWPIYFAGMFFNTCLPTSIGGDVIRVVGLGKHTQSKTAALASVFMDRNVGMTALLALGFLSSVLAHTTIQVTFSTFYPEPFVVALWPLFLLLMLGFVLANAVLFSRRWFARMQVGVLLRLPAKARLKLEKLHAALQAYRRPAAAYAGTFMLSLGYQASEALLVWVLALGLGLDLPFWVFGSLVMFQAVAGLLPITVNNIGVREGLFCAVLIGQAYRIGLGPDEIKAPALALSMAYLGIIICSGLVGGLVYLASGLAKPTAVEVAAEDAAMAGPPAPAVAALVEASGSKPGPLAMGSWEKRISG